MSETYLFYSAIAVFSLMFIGLVATMLEFRYGQPKKQDDKAKAERELASKLHKQEMGLGSKGEVESRERDVV